MKKHKKELTKKESVIVSVLTLVNLGVVCALIQSSHDEGYSKGVSDMYDAYNDK